MYGWEKVIEGLKLHMIGDKYQKKKREVTALIKSKSGVTCIQYRDESKQKYNLSPEVLNGRCGKPIFSKVSYV